jgi:hypothetical protein
VVTENTQDSTTTDPLMGLLALGQCPSLRTAVYLSMEWFQDSGVEPVEWLSNIFGIRFGRALGHSNWLRH